MAPLVTILIPTRNRADVLEWSLRSVSAQDFAGLEIIVSDNASDLDVRQVVERVSDPRVRYIRTPRRMGMTEHWNWAIDQVRGTWLSIIGDDDGLTPGAISRVSEIISEAREVEHISCALATYVWPGVKGSGAPSLSVPVGQERPKFREMQSLASKALAGETSWRQLPMIYTGGWVRVDTLRRIALTSGPLLRGMAPDVFSGAALSRVVTKAVVLDEALAITGCSAHSNGLAHLRGKPRSSNDPGFAFTRETAYRIHPALQPDSDDDVLVSDYGFFLDAWLNSAPPDTDTLIDWRSSVTALVTSSMDIHNAELRQNEIARSKRVAAHFGVDWEVCNREALGRRRAHYRSALTALRNWKQLVNRVEVKVLDNYPSNVLEAAELVGVVRGRPPTMVRRAFRAASFGATRVIPRLREAIGMQSRT